ncbi:MAG TPA: exo-beta-N-acetylmuramidase NamZ domain-containing protein [Thermoanaerobaculia bacterium]
MIVLAAVLAANIDAAVNTAIADHKLPGGVIWVERGKNVYHRAYGHRALVPHEEPMTEDTIFDAASLTKVTATTPSIWLLIERGKIRLDDPVSKYLPEFHGGWRDEVTIRHLLTHTSGLRPDLDLREPWSGYDTAMKMAFAEMPLNRPGYVFRYSDINFELLGEIVHRMSGVPLDVFAEREIFRRLGMRDTFFERARPSPGPSGHPLPEGEGQDKQQKQQVPLPTGERGAERSEATDGGRASARIAPTEMTDGVMLRGVVHDPTARRMGGVAGHAGLFTTAKDLAKYARMLLRGGSPIFKPETVQAMTRVQTPPNVAVRRTGGFDLDSSFSRPRGEIFPIGSYGHTGFTGGFYWIDPYSKTFYIFLSNRVHPNGKGSVTALQRRLGTMVAEAMGVEERDVLPERTGGRVEWVTGGADVQNGIDVLHNSGYQALQGLRVGLVTNHTGIDRAGNPTIDLLRSAPGVTLVSLFSPEHGIRGTSDENVGDTKDPVSGLPVYSLYGAHRKPLPEQLANIDALVFDIQDVGARFYTYISTLANILDAASEAHKKVIVLDRVNPIGGDAVEGPRRDGPQSFIAWHDIVIRHGLTVGEFAKMYAGENHLAVDLEVVPLHGWKRSMWQDDAGLPWINTSPNMRSLTAAGLYPGLGLLESALSVGRGTAIPFEVVGAPYIDGATLERELGVLPGVSAHAFRFTPKSSVFANQVCGGVRLTITDRTAFHAVDTGLAIATTVRRLYGDKFAVDKMAPLLLSPKVLDAVRDAKPIGDIVALYRADEQAFRERRGKYLLY